MFQSGLLLPLQNFFEGYIWIFVFSILAIFVLRHFIIKFKNYSNYDFKKSENTILHVVDADRKARFDTQRKKVRVYQQLDVYKASREAYMEEGNGRTIYNNKSTGNKDT